MYEIYLDCSKTRYMVSVNANLDLKTIEVIDTGRMNEDLADLCEEELGITFIARDSEFYKEAWYNEEKGKTYIRVVLPYEEVLNTQNIDRLAYQHLYQQLDQLTWMDFEAMKNKLTTIIARIN